MLHLLSEQKIQIQIILQVWRLRIFFAPGFLIRDFYFRTRGYQACKFQDIFVVHPDAAV